jgi:hypothetical protein
MLNDLVVSMAATQKMEETGKGDYPPPTGKHLH